MTRWNAIVAFSTSVITEATYPGVTSRRRRGRPRRWGCGASAALSWRKTWSIMAPRWTRDGEKSDSDSLITLDGQWDDLKLIRNFSGHDPFWPQLVWNWQSCCLVSFTQNYEFPKMQNCFGIWIVDRPFQQQNGTAGLLKIKRTASLLDASSSASQQGAHCLNFWIHQHGTTNNQSKMEWRIFSKR